MKRLILTIALVATLIPAAAQQKWGVVNLSAAFLRNAPDYESALETQALMGSVVEVMAQQSYWKLVNMQEPPYMAWTNELAIVEMNEQELQEYIAAPKFICTKDFSAIYDKPFFNAEKISEFVLGDIVRKVTSARGKATIAPGYYCVMLPDGREGYVRMQDVKDFDSWTAERAATMDNLVKTARRFIGTPYMWGGTSIKNVDCSGLVWNVYFLNGILLPRNASQMVKCGEEVSTKAMQPGDLVFFGKPADEEHKERITHVAMYIGDGCIIHSSQLVRINSLDPDGENPYRRTPLHARRIIGHTTDNTGIRLLCNSPYYFPQGN